MDTIEYTINEAILKFRQEIKSDRMDMSFGEIINMYKDREIIISPEYQRAFRWDTQRQTDFIETVLLGLPFPSIFVAANDDGKWELIDGLQRVSTILSFFGELEVDPVSGNLKNNLVLEKGSLIPELEGLTISTLPMSLKLQIKRTPCRIEIIQKDSEFSMRYELFKRLNTGGEGLSRQEIRNCIFRGNDNTFNKSIKEMSNIPIFRDLVHISDSQIEEMYYEELSLRFIALFNTPQAYSQKNIQDFLDEYMEQQSKQPNPEKYASEAVIFQEILEYLSQVDNDVFKLSRQAFSTSVYDALMLSFATHLDSYKSTSFDDMKAKIDLMKNSEEFRKYTGSASSSSYRIANKIKEANKVLFNEI